MRKLVYAINLTLDGCCDHTKVRGSEEILDYYSGLLQRADTFLYGRVTYQLMVPYWPDIAKNPTGNARAAVDYALAFAAVKNIVVISKTLEKVEDENTRIIHTNLQEEILALKQQPGKDIFMGGVDIPGKIIELGLVDEFYFVYQPLVVGEGRRLFNGVNLPEALQLKLIESKVFPSGNVSLRYAKI